MRCHLRNFVILLCVLGLQFQQPPDARSEQTSLSVEHPSVRVTIPGRPAAGYVIIKNSSATPDAVLSATSPKAKRIELHTHLMDSGIMRMRPVDKVDVPANGTAEFKSGGNHLMIFGLDPSAGVGGNLPVTLKFSSGVTLDVTFLVEKAGAVRGAGQKRDHKH